MRVGIEGTHIFDARQEGAIPVLDRARDLELEGVFFKSVLDLSPTLDRGELEEVKAHADSLDLYVEVGVGLINPFALAEKPRIRALGGGDTLRAFELMIEAAAWIGCADLLAVTGQWKAGLPGRYAYDRFRTDVSWAQQLDATEVFIRRLAPALRGNGARIALETHEEITSFEVARMIENVGADVLGATFDVGNVLVRGEDPVAAARRLAPFVRLSHVKDAVMLLRPHGMVRQLRPCGQGVVDWPELLSVLHSGNPGLNLSIEDNQGYMDVEYRDPDWLAAHPDLTEEELAGVVELARSSEDRIAAGVWPEAAGYDAHPWEEHKLVRLRESRDFLRSALAEAGFDRRPVRGG
ncbi:sugar phosphate isomerase/epimerase family protein [Planotetraspora sp. GP83]|uniref:sugar phosphate isomerase/epimerase family protein n=1 Tax=Planotetraspora sp. GP83 TaxID=3156264 RepID=UPI00351730B2